MLEKQQKKKKKNYEKKPSISSPGSSKAPNTKAFYIRIWIQVIEKLKCIYLFGERFLTTISPVSSRNVKPKFRFGTLNLVAMTITVTTLSSTGSPWFHLLLKGRVYFGLRETGMMDRVSDKGSEGWLLFSAPSIDLCGHRLVT